MKLNLVLTVIYLTESPFTVWLECYLISHLLNRIRLYYLPSY